MTIPLTNPYLLTFLTIVYLCLGSMCFYTTQSVYNDGDSFKWLYKLPKFVIFVWAYFIWPLGLVLQIFYFIWKYFWKGLMWSFTKTAKKG